MFTETKTTYFSSIDNIACDRDHSKAASDMRAYDVTLRKP